MADHPKEWKRRLAKLESIDWSRSNAKLWEGRAMSTGRLSKRLINVGLTGNAIKKHLGLKLTADEQEWEEQFERSRNGQNV